MRLFNWLFRRRRRVEQAPEETPPLVPEISVEPPLLPAPEPSAQIENIGKQPVVAIGPAIETTPPLLLTEAAKTPSALVPAGGPLPLTIELPPANQAATEVSAVTIEAQCIDALPGPLPPAALLEAAPSEPPTVQLSPANQTDEPSLLPALSSEAHTKERDLYFTPGLYSPSNFEARLPIGPDLSFRARFEKARKPATRLLAPSPAAVSPSRVARHLMDDFVTARYEPLPAAPPVIAAVDPLLLTAFFSDREAGPNVPTQATAAYLTEPALLALGLTLRDRVIANWRGGAAPLSATEFYALARDLSGHAATALLLCHNLSKAIARGSGAIQWEIADRSVPTYFDGHNRITAVRSHRAGVLRSDALAAPSIFYLLFSIRELAAGDPGDWYRYFASAAIASYTCQALTVGTAVVPIGSPAGKVALRVVETARTIRNADIETTPAYRGWVWANALSFDEGAMWGRSLARNREASRAALHGAVFGLGAARHAVDGKWRWHVPAPGGGTAEVMDPNPCA